MHFVSTLALQTGLDRRIIYIARFVVQVAKWCCRFNGSDGTIVDVASTPLAKISRCMRKLSGGLHALLSLLRWEHAVWQEHLGQGERLPSASQVHSTTPPSAGNHHHHN
ncbi:unnamed protein product, partial [Dibothriocephalus latus]